MGLYFSATGKCSFKRAMSLKKDSVPLLYLYSKLNFQHISLNPNFNKNHNLGKVRTNWHCEKNQKRPIKCHMLQAKYFSANNTIHYTFAGKYTSNHEYNQKVKKGT